MRLQCDRNDRWPSFCPARARVEHKSIFSGGDVNGNIWAFDSAIVSLTGGSVGVGRSDDEGYAMYAEKRLATALSAHENSTNNMYSGVIGQGFVASMGGTINLFGGSFETGFLVGPGGTVNVYGRDLVLTPIETGDTYIENHLTGQRSVLFCGRPCDVTRELRRATTKSQSNAPLATTGRSGLHEVNLAVTERPGGPTSMTAASIRSLAVTTL